MMIEKPLMYLLSLHAVAMAFCTILSFIVEPNNAKDIVGYLYNFQGLYGIYLGIVSGFIGNGALYYLLQHINPLIVSVIINFEPVTGTFIAWIFGMEKVITLSTLLGGLVVIIGNMITTISSNLKKKNFSQSVIDPEITEKL